MVEAVYNASGLGLPIVMTVANRAIGAPINIWNDHSDAMSQRDSGWIQLYAATNQEAVDLHVQAFKLAEEVSLPVMVCMDGFVLTRLRGGRSPDAGAGRRLPAHVRAASGARSGRPGDDRGDGRAEAFTEVRYLMHAKQMQALDAIPEIAGEFSQAFGRSSGGLTRAYRSEDAETVVVALGSVLGTIEEVVDELRGGRRADRRTWDHVLPAVAGGRDSQGAGQRTQDRRSSAPSRWASAASSARRAARPVRPGAGLRRRRGPGRAGDHEGVAPTRCSATCSTSASHWIGLRLDLDRTLVGRELMRIRETRRSGPHAENILRDVGAVAARPH